MQGGNIEDTLVIDALCWADSQEDMPQAGIVAAAHAWAAARESREPAHAGPSAPPRGIGPRVMTRYPISILPDHLTYRYCHHPYRYYHLNIIFISIL